MTAAGARADAPTAHWLARALRPQQSAIPWFAALRVLIGMALPIALTMPWDKTGYGVLLSLGAMMASFGDRPGPYRLRLISFLPAQIAAAVGIFIGHQFADSGWTIVIMVTVVALVAGVISPIGAVASGTGLNLLVNTAVGTGVPMPDPWWMPPLLIFAGGLTVVLLSLLPWPLRRNRPERGTVAEVYRAVADLLRAGGTPGETDARRRLSAAVDTAYDGLVRYRARTPGRVPAAQRLMDALNAVSPILEASAAATRQRTLDEAYPAAVDRIADAIERGDRHVPRPELTPVTVGEQALAAGLRHASGCLDPKPANGQGPVSDLGVDPDLIALPDHPGGPRGAMVHLGRVLAGSAPWLYGLRLALCMGIAASLVMVLDLPRSYWVLLTVGLVLKPDFGSVFVRGLLRLLGTAAGVIIAAGLLVTVPRGWPDVVLIALLAGLLPIAASRSYGMQAAAITPLILVLTNVPHPADPGQLSRDRLLDTLLGCAVVLIFGYLLWPGFRQAKLPLRLVEVTGHAGAYLRRLIDPEEPGRPDAEGYAVRSRARRQAYATLTRTRAAFQQALAEPPPASRRAAAWWPYLVQIERVIDTVAAASASIDHGAPVPGREQVDRWADELAAMAEAISSGELPEADPARPATDTETAFDAVTVEISTARALVGQLLAPEPGED